MSRCSPTRLKIVWHGDLQDERPLYAAGVTPTVPGFGRLTVEADKLGGQPCIRGYRFSVEQLLGLLADGLTVEQIQADYPFVEQADVADVLRFAAALADRAYYMRGRSSA